MIFERKDKMNFKFVDGFCLALLYIVIAIIWLFAACVNFIFAFFIFIPRVHENFKCFNEQIIKTLGNIHLEDED